MSRQANIQKLIVYYNRRLQKLREQEALKGINTPPETLIEIEDIEEKLEAWQTELDSLGRGFEPAPTMKAMTDEALEREVARFEGGGQPQPQVNIGNVNLSGISGGSINIGGNVSDNVQAGGDVVERDKIGHESQAAADPAASQAILQAALAQWQQEIATKIAALSELDADEKEELQNKATKVKQEATKGEAANVGKIERLLNTMSSMAPDILEVTATTLQNPFKGVGLVLEKINDRIKLERES